MSLNWGVWKSFLKKATHKLTAEGQLILKSQSEVERVCQQQQKKKMVKGKARGYEMLATAIFYLILQTMKGMIKDPVGNL